MQNQVIRFSQLITHSQYQQANYLIINNILTIDFLILLQNYIDNDTQIFKIYVIMISFISESPN